MIYVFIAGSYFPWLTLEQLPNEGWSSQMRWIVWFLAFMGITYQQIFHEKYKMLETIFYLIMGIGPICPVLSEVRNENKLTFSNARSKYFTQDYSTFLLILISNSL